MKNIKWALLGYVILVACVAALVFPSFASGEPVITGAIPLVIYNVQASTTTTGTVTISWQTNGNATSQVFYGTTSNSSTDGYAFHSAVNSTTVLNHSVTLTGLSAATIYHYRIKSVAVIDGTEFTAVSPDTTFTAASGGGGGGGAWSDEEAGTTPPTYSTLGINMWDKSGLSDNWLLSKEGILQKAVDATSLDGTLTIHIANGSTLLDSTGKPISQIDVTLIAPPADPPAGYHILKTFNFNPDGATFAPNMELILSFDPSRISSGETVVIAFYNEATNKWEFIEGNVTADGTATFTITHFSVYALMAGSEVTKTPPSTTTTPTTGGIGTTAIIGIAIGVLVLLTAGIWLAMRSRKTKKA